jgi:xanthine dehydrogenase accessory factor
MIWLESVAPILRQGRHAVRVSVARVRGSTPREAGAAMVVTHNDFAGSIGGGQLEYVALLRARRMLDDCTEERLEIEAFPLGAELGQCCGGHVTLLFERLSPVQSLPWIDDALAWLRQGKPLNLHVRMQVGGSPEHELSEGVSHSLRRHLSHSSESISFVESIDPRKTPLLIYGAGHVGRALVQVLADTDFAIQWIEERPGFLPQLDPPGLYNSVTDDAVAAACAAPADAFHLVMTHSHELDYQIVRAILERDHFAWLGLIGSETKATCFRIRLGRDGINDSLILRLVSPIGLPALQGRGKAPSTISIAVAAQLLIERQLQEETAHPIAERAL